VSFRQHAEAAFDSPIGGWISRKRSPIRRGGNDAFDCLRYAKGYTGQSIASARKAKIMEAPPMENRSRSDIACLLAAVIFDAPGNGRVPRESRNAAQIQNRPTWLSAACSWVPRHAGG
jgi:hypothetical protein